LADGTQVEDVQRNTFLALGDQQRTIRGEALRIQACLLRISAEITLPFIRIQWGVIV
jgi:hypothetical protein